MADYLVTSQLSGKLRYHVKISVPVSVRDKIGKKSLSQILEAQTYDQALIESKPIIEAFRQQIAEASSGAQRTVKFLVRVHDDPQEQDRFVRELGAFLKGFDESFDPSSLEVRRSQINKRSKKA